MLPHVKTKNLRNVHAYARLNKSYVRDIFFTRGSNTLPYNLTLNLTLTLIPISAPYDGQTAL